MNMGDKKPSVCAIFLLTIRKHLWKCTKLYLLHVMEGDISTTSLEQYFLDLHHLINTRSLIPTTAEENLQIISKFSGSSREFKFKMNPKGRFSFTTTSL